MTSILLPVNTRPVDPSLAEQMRAWGADPDLGKTLADGLTEAGFQVITFDYEGRLARHPQPDTLTADQVAADLLAVADEAGVERFAYYGYSWLALSGLQLALRTDRLTGLAMGGYPPLGGPYDAMLTVTRAAHRMALENAGKPPRTEEIEPGDWDAAGVSATPDQTKQYLTLYESLIGFDERAALSRLTVGKRLAFAGEDDNIQYNGDWDDAYVGLADGLATNRDELISRGWTVELIAGADHIKAMQAAVVLPILIDWLRG